MIPTKKRLPRFFIITFIMFGLTIPVWTQEYKPPKNNKEQRKEQRVIMPKKISADEGGRPLARPPQPAPVKISEQQKIEIIEFYKQIEPDIEKNLEKLRVRNPQKYERKLQNLYREYVFLNRLREEEPERYQKSIELRKLSATVRVMANNYKKSDSDSERGIIRIKLKDTLYKIFDLREKERVAEMDRIKKKLVRLQDEMVERQNNKDQIIDNRINKLIGKEHLYEW
jgi:hypothetical protein